MSKKLHNFLQAFLQSKLKLQDTFEWQGITFTYLGCIPEGCYNFSVFSSKTADLSLLQIYVVNKNITKIKKNPFDGALLRLIHKGYTDEPERVYTGKDYKEVVFDKADFLYMLTYLYEKQKEKYDKYFLNKFQVAYEDLRRLFQSFILSCPILVAKTNSIKDIELLLKVWLYQRGYIPLEEVACLWYGIIGKTPEEELNYILNHVTFLSVSGIKKYLKTFKHQQLKQEVPYNDKVKYEEMASFKQERLTITRLVEKAKDMGVPFARKTFYNYLKKHKNKEQALKEVINKKQETAFRKELINLYMQKKNCSFNTAKVWVSRKVNALKSRKWDIERIFEKLRAEISN